MTEQKGPGPQDMGIDSEAGQEEIAEKFRNTAFMLVEDDPRVQLPVRDALMSKRGEELDGQELTLGNAMNQEDVEEAFKKVMEAALQNPDRRIVSINDLEIPLKKGQSANKGGGISAMKKMVEMVNGWNAENQGEEPIKLDIILNTSLERSWNEDTQKKYEEMLGGPYVKGLNSERKHEAVNAIENHFRGSVQG